MTHARCDLKKGRKEKRECKKVCCIEDNSVSCTRWTDNLREQWTGGDELEGSIERERERERGELTCLIFLP